MSAMDGDWREDVEMPVPADAPVMIAWEAYKASDQYANSRRWAKHEEHVDGSMWAAFYAGFFAMAINASAAADATAAVNDDQIKHIVERFLSWRLPENFNPDGGVSFKKTFNEQTAHPMKHEPTGTNLLDAEQATAMVRHMIAELPSP